MKIKLLPQGQSLLEVVLATTLIAIGIVAALSLANTSQKSTNYSKSLNLATNYSYEVADWLRSTRSLLGWDNFTYYLSQDSAGTGVTYCLNSTLPDESSFPDLESGPCPEGSYLDSTIYSRSVTLDLSNLASDSLSAEITTSWQENTTRSNTLEIKLNKWD